ncbi:hypothetical protein [Methylobacterium soli]|uniref:Uncharacterized protein n=1 Tax=Methylobacterium soli TaxID=553447 RepID=A0A6L3SSJ3_9HYPH|nr:hypothetical protein [Methylobacterium soli]KAB1076513.1 hypothetical protein F6X53_22675 [Methylobacterium soli]GJE44850.1 hypothetical protein AEGHOMDF_4041 [Methylobacterium soli]
MAFKRTGALLAGLAVSVVVGNGAAAAEVQMRRENFKSVQILVSPDFSDQSWASICNAVAFSQIPGLESTFVGRVMNAQDGGCAGTGWSIGFFRMDWKGPRLILEKMALRLPVKSPDGILINKGYDPHVVSHEGELLVAFECTHHQGVSTCIAPLSVSKGIDVSRLSIPVRGLPLDPTNPSGHSASASVPKLLSFKGRLYVFWSPVKQRNRDGTWLSINTRGAELTKDPATGKLWVTGARSRPVPSEDPELTVTVADFVRSDKTADTINELMDVQAEGDRVAALVSRGGTEAGQPCLASISKARPCYRLTIAYAINPLAPNAFNIAAPQTVEIPSNPQAYARFVTNPQGERKILSMFHPFQLEKLDNSAPIERGLTYYPAPGTAEAPR